MGTLIKPSSFSLEKWMQIDIPNTQGRSLFTFSGFARFVAPMLFGVGGNNSSDQNKFVDYDVTEMVVGPHWVAGTVTGICPSVVAAGHVQDAPDEADGMGYHVTEITKVDLVSVASGFDRIELHVSCSVRGGTLGSIPSLAYHVAAFGRLGKSLGKEGVFFGDPAF